MLALAGVFKEHTNVVTDAVTVTAPAARWLGGAAEAAAATAMAAAPAGGTPAASSGTPAASGGRPAGTATAAAGTAGNSATERRQLRHRHRCRWAEGRERKERLEQEFLDAVTAPGIWFKESLKEHTGHPEVRDNADEAEPDSEPIIEEHEEDEDASSLEELPSITALIARLDQLELIEVQRERIGALGFVTTVDADCRILVRV